VMLDRLAGDDGKAYLARLIAARRQREALVVETDLATGARRIASSAASTAQSSIVTDGGREIFRHVHAPTQRTVIIGATHIGQALAAFARMAEHEVTVIDPRSAFAASQRFPDVALVTEWPGEALAALGLDAFTAVAVVAHVEHIDDEALISALKAKCAYVGALGSKRSHARRVERLTAAGLTPAEIGKIRAPIGLDIGAATPPEIALSIMAEIVAAFRRPARNA
jgi:xanthine dehydrogenase accessory factor